MTDTPLTDDKERQEIREHSRRFHWTGDVPVERLLNDLEAAERKLATKKQV